MIILVYNVGVLHTVYLIKSSKNPPQEQFEATPLVPILIKLHRFSNPKLMLRKVKIVINKTC